MSNKKERWRGGLDIGTPRQEANAATRKVVYPDLSASLFPPNKAPCPPPPPPPTPPRPPPRQQDHQQQPGRQSTSSPWQRKPQTPHTRKPLRGNQVDRLQQRLKHALAVRSSKHPNRNSMFAKALAKVEALREPIRRRIWGWLVPKGQRRTG